MESSPALPQTLCCDVKRLHQVLVNLLDNALKYTEEGTVTLHADYADGYLALAVIDTGIGIPQARMEAIFEPFEQAGGPGHRAQGAGLGLAITKRLVERMDGTLSVDSMLGQGSTFRVRIPVQAISSPGESKPEERSATRVIGYRCTEDQGSLRVLIADDEPENRKVLRHLLEPLGFAVAEVKTGRGCIETAQAWTPDLILMDLRMPDMDGLEATQALRGLPAFQDTPIVAVTAAAFAEDRARTLAAGCDVHLAKPVLQETLIETLGTLLPLEWIRGEAGTEVEASLGLAALSPEQAERLARLVRTGSVTAVKALAEELAQDGGCLALAQRIGALADEFDTAGLRRLVKTLDDLNHHGAKDAKEIYTT
jgi:CheY-like chemotaxis protein